MSKWVGYAVSVNCGEPLGCYQGTILKADGNTITLTKAFRNGFPYPKSEVTLNAADIKELKIIEARLQPTEQTHSTVSVSKTNKKAQKATVCENLQANPTNSVAVSQSATNVSNNNKGTNARSQNPGAGPTRSKPIDIQGNRTKNNNNAGSYGNSGSTPKGRAGGTAAARRRNEACFGDLPAHAFSDDFDFEGNLALFDKRAEWARMRPNRPDLLRQAEAQLRPDEPVLAAGAAAAGAAGAPALVIPEELRASPSYVTDLGAVVPAASAALRRQLFAGLERLGLAETTATLVARAACDVALRLVGGGRRLEARNRHQAPVVAGLLRTTAAARCLRLLHAHGARAALHVPDPADVPAGLAAELGLLEMEGVRAVRPAALPPPDLVLLGLHDPQHPARDRLYPEVLAWAQESRAAVLAVEPSAATLGELRCRASVCGALVPGGGGAGGAGGAWGRVYLACVAPPAPLLRALRLEYRPPFGAAAALPLHQHDD